MQERVLVPSKPAGIFIETVHCRPSNLINIGISLSIQFGKKNNAYTMKGQHQLIVLFLNLIVINYSSSFTIPQHCTSRLITRNHQHETQLSAKQGSSKKRATRNTVGNRTKSATGFGGAAISPCPCGSQSAYMKCCGLLHTNAKAYADATAEQVVRARYSAYAKRQV